MKKTQTFKYCEFCDKALLDVSPPTPEQYEQGMITVREGSVALTNWYQPSEAVTPHISRGRTAITFA
ncbi:MAG: hypothetical protein ACYC7L_06870 [Nitrospirota bacterium]